MRRFTLFSCFVSLLVCISCEETAKQEPARSTSIRQVVTHQQIVPPTLIHRPQPIPLHQHRSNQKKNVHLVPYIVPKVRTNVPRARPVRPLRPLYHDDTAYVKFINIEKKDALKTDSASSDDIVNLYFDFIKNNDENNCLMKLICQIGFNGTAFGHFGEQVASFFSELPSDHGPAIEYLEAFNTHKKHSNQSVCMQKYPSCHHDTNDMMEVGNDLMNKNLTNVNLGEAQKEQIWLARIR